MPPHITSMQLGLRISFRRIFWSSVWCQNHSFYSVSGPPAVFCFFRDELRDFRMINAPFLESSGHSLTPPYPKSQAPSEWQTSGWSLSFVIYLVSNLLSVSQRNNNIACITKWALGAAAKCQLSMRWFFSQHRRWSYTISFRYGKQRKTLQSAFRVSCTRNVPVLAWSRPMSLLVQLVSRRRNCAQPWW